MATRLYLRNTETTVLSDFNYGGAWLQSYKMALSNGVAAYGLQVYTIDGASSVLWGIDGAGTYSQFVSDRIAKPFTMTSGTVTVPLLCEADANVYFRCNVLKYKSTGELVDLGDYDNLIEITNTSVSDYSITTNIPDTAFDENDRIVLRFYVVNYNSTMIGDVFVTMYCNGSYPYSANFNINENVTFYDWEEDYKSKYYFGKNPNGTLPYADNNTIDENSSLLFKPLLERSVEGGSLSKFDITSTYPLIYTTSSQYIGGILSVNGDIHMVPYSAKYGQKISSFGVVSTYNLIYTGGTYTGAVLSPKGDIHFIPRSSTIGQKVNSSGVVSTYSINIGGYAGGVLSPSGEIHCVPVTSTMGMKINITGGTSTYSLVHTSGSYYGGVLSYSGDIHFVPLGASVGQKINLNGTVSTYTLVKTGSNTYAGGVLAPNGDIHFIPYNTSCGQKINSLGIVSTYTLVYTGDGFVGSYNGGVLAPNGDIHFIPYYAPVGQKVSSTGVVSTYVLVYTTGQNCAGGVLLPNGDIHFIPYQAVYGQKILTQSAIPFGIGICCSPFFNKF